MIKYSDTKNVLMESNWKPNLQDVGTPNLYRELYSYDSIPKIAFNFRQTPMEIPSELWITDTTFRDGQQATKPFTSKQIVELYKMMHRFGGKKGIIRHSEFFLYSEKDREAVRACMELGYDFPEITSWIRASEKDFELVKEMKIKSTSLYILLILLYLTHTFLLPFCQSTEIRQYRHEGIQNNGSGKLLMASLPTMPSSFQSPNQLAINVR